tara:strand:+ start:1413 stop:2003 length:591 start_codon:yes stop_codon:yes gene_type:complete
VKFKVGKLDFKKQWKESSKYLAECRKHIIAIVLIFLASGAFGFFAREHLTGLDDLLRQIILQTEGLNTLELIFFIMQNNVQSALYGVFGGLFFGVFPVVTGLLNGVVIGYVLGRVYDVSGLIDFWRLLPHGVFELPAIFIALGLGLRFGGAVFVKKDRWAEVKKRFYQSMNVFLLIVLPLLILAAVIEGILIVFVG